MVKRIVLSLVLTAQLSMGHAQMAAVLQPIESFQEGEWFQLRLHYGPFNASYATFSLERDTLRGKPVFHAKGFGETTGLARWFFKVEDYYESYCDDTAVLPYKFIREINEGGDTKNVEIDLDKEEGTAILNDKKKGEINEFSITDGVQDLISCCLHLLNL